MHAALGSLDRRLVPAEQLFFTWLMRVFVSATLVGCAWIDDAPPLDGAAAFLGLYVAIRVATQVGNFFAAAPFDNKLLKGGFAVWCLVLLGLSFLSVVTFVEHVALFVAR